MGMCGKIALVLVAATAFLCRDFDKHWLFYNLDRRDFDTKLDFTLVDVPTTYYKGGAELRELTKEWVDDFILFRSVEPVSPFDHTDLNTTLMAFKEEDLVGGSSFCINKAMVLNRLHEVSTDEVFKGGWSASFANADYETIQKLFATVDFGFTLDKTNIEHVFLSNFEEGVLTASLHANPITQSVAVQFTGQKTWLFIEPEDMWNVFQASSCAGSLFAQNIRSKPFNMYKYTSQPGDVLFFPASMGHMVYTHPGPQIMVNFRKLTKQSVLAQPHQWFASVANMILFGFTTDRADVVDGEEFAKKGHRTFFAEKKKTVANPSKFLNLYRNVQYEKLCGPIWKDVLAGEYDFTHTETFADVKYTKADRQILDVFAEDGLTYSME